MPLATLKVLGGTFKLNAIACSRACYARACICSESILPLLLVLLVLLLLLWFAKSIPTTTRKLFPNRHYLGDF